MRKQKGFSLIELLIVVAIILILVGIAIPSLRQGKISADETSAVGSIRAINTAQVSYQSIYPTVGYAATIPSLGPPDSTGCPASGPTSANACLVDWSLTQATTSAAAKSGYYFGMGVVATGGVNQGYTLGSAPAAFNQNGVRGFCSNEDGVIRFTPSLNGPPVTTREACAAYLTI